jgi:hypothetical protein
LSPGKSSRARWVSIRDGTLQKRVSTDIAIDLVKEAQLHGIGGVARSASWFHHLLTVEPEQFGRFCGKRDGGCPAHAEADFEVKRLFPQPTLQQICELSCGCEISVAQVSQI